MLEINVENTQRPGPECGGEGRAGWGAPGDRTGGRRASVLETTALSRRAPAGPRAPSRARLGAAGSGSPAVWWAGVGRPGRCPPPPRGEPTPSAQDGRGPADPVTDPLCQLNDVLSALGGSGPPHTAVCFSCIHRRRRRGTARFIAAALGTGPRRGRPSADLHVCRADRPGDRCGPRPGAGQLTRDPTGAPGPSPWRRPGGKGPSPPGLVPGPNAASVPSLAFLKTRDKENFPAPPPPAPRAPLRCRHPCACMLPSLEQPPAG